uniref:Genome polyprotein n=1 Tax=Warroolaba Creek virus 1 TaxID=2714906 RepID=A0A6G7M5E8_9VIRU|nr:hypothetical protein [Warroolaba Creek virus 1]
MQLSTAAFRNEQQRSSTHIRNHSKELAMFKLKRKLFSEEYFKGQHRLDKKEYFKGQQCLDKKKVKEEIKGEKYVVFDYYHLPLLENEEIDHDALEREYQRVMSESTSCALSDRDATIFIVGLCNRSPFCPQGGLIGYDGIKFPTCEDEYCSIEHKFMYGMPQMRDPGFCEEVTRGVHKIKFLKSIHPQLPRVWAILHWLSMPGVVHPSQKDCSLKQYYLDIAATRKSSRAGVTPPTPMAAPPLLKDLGKRRVPGVSEDKPAEARKEMKPPKKIEVIEFNPSIPPPNILGPPGSVLEDISSRIFPIEEPMPPVPPNTPQPKEEVFFDSSAPPPGYKVEEKSPKKKRSRKKKKAKKQEVEEPEVYWDPQREVWTQEPPPKPKRAEKTPKIPPAESPKETLFSVPDFSTLGGRTAWVAMWDCRKTVPLYGGLSCSKQELISNFGDDIYHIIRQVEYDRDIALQRRLLQYKRTYQRAAQDVIEHPIAEKQSKSGISTMVVSLKDNSVEVSHKKIKTPEPVLKVNKKIILPTVPEKVKSSKVKQNSRRALNRREFPPLNNGVDLLKEAQHIKESLFVPSKERPIPPTLSEVVQTPPRVKSTLPVKKSTSPFPECKIPPRQVDSDKEGFIPGSFRRDRRSPFNEYNSLRREFYKFLQRKREKDKLYAVKRRESKAAKAGMSNRDLLKQCPDVEKNPGPVLSKHDVCKAGLAAVVSGLWQCQNSETPETNLYMDYVGTLTTVLATVYGTQYVATKAYDMYRKFEYQIQDKCYELGQKFKQGVFGEQKDESPWSRIIQNSATHSLGLAACCFSMIQAENYKQILLELPKIASLLSLDEEVLKMMWNKIGVMRAEKQMSGTQIASLTAIIATLSGFDFVKKFEQIGRVQRGVDPFVSQITQLLNDLGICEDPTMAQLREYQSKLEDMRKAFDFFTRMYEVCPSQILDPTVRQAWDRLREDVSNMLSLCERSGMSQVRSSSIVASLSRMRSDVNKLDTKYAHIWASNNIRPVTLGIAIGGRSQIGKTHLARHLFERVKQELYVRFQSDPTLYSFSDANRWTCWNENARDNYEQGYIGQRVGYTDDAFSLKDNTDHPAWLTRLTGETCLTTQADLADKGRPYEARFHLVSYNNYPTGSQTISNLDALFNRFPIHVWVSLKPGASPPKGEQYDASFDWLDFHLDEMNGSCASGQGSCGTTASVARDGDKLVAFPGHNPSASYVSKEQLVEKIVLELVRRERSYQSARSAYNLPVFDPTLGLKLPEDEFFGGLTAAKQVDISEMSLELALDPFSEELYTAFNGFLQESLTATRWKPIFLTKVFDYLEEHNISIANSPLIKITDGETEVLKINIPEECIEVNRGNSTCTIWRAAKCYFLNKWKLELTGERVDKREGSWHLYQVPSEIRKAGLSDPVTTCYDPRISWMLTLKDADGLFLNDYWTESPIKTLRYLLELLTYVADTEENRALIEMHSSSLEPVMRFNEEGMTSFLWGPALNAGRSFYPCPTFFRLPEESKSAAHWDQLVQSINSGRSTLAPLSLLLPGFLCNLLNLGISAMQFRRGREPVPFNLYTKSVDNPYLPFNWTHNNRLLAIMRDVISFPCRLFDRVFDTVGRVTEFLSDPIRKVLYVVSDWFGFSRSKWIDFAIYGVSDTLALGGLVFLAILGVAAIKHAFFETEAEKVAPPKMDKYYPPVGGKSRPKLLKHLKSKMEQKEKVEREFYNMYGDPKSSDVVFQFKDGVSLGSCSEEELFDMVDLLLSNMAEVEADYPDLKRLDGIHHSGSGTEDIVYILPGEGSLKNTSVIVFDKIWKSSLYPGIQLNLRSPISLLRELSRKVAKLTKALCVVESGIYLQKDGDFLELDLWFTKTNHGDAPDGVITRKMLSSVRDLFSTLKSGGETLYPAGNLVSGPGIALEDKSAGGLLSSVIQRAKSKSPDVMEQQMIQYQSIDDASVDLCRSVVSRHCVRVVKMSQFNSPPPKNWEVAAYGIGHGLMDGEAVWVCAHYGDIGDYFRIYMHGLNAGSSKLAKSYLVGRMVYRDEFTENAFLSFISYNEWEGICHTYGIPTPTEMFKPHFDPPTGLRNHLLTLNDVTNMAANEECLEWLPESGVSAHGTLTLVNTDINWTDKTTTKNFTYWRIRGASTSSSLSRAGDCGGPVFILQKKLSRKLIGIHTLASRGCSGCTVMSVELWDEIYPSTRKEMRMLEIDPRMEDRWVAAIQPGHCAEAPPEFPALGVITPPSPPAGFQRENKWIQSHFFGAFGAKRLPSVMSVSDPRIVTPLPTNRLGEPSLTMRAVSAFCQELPPLNDSVIPFLEQELTVYYLSQFYGCDMSSPNDPNECLREAITALPDSKFMVGIKVNSSSGYPWNSKADYMKKSDFVSVNPETGERTWKECAISTVHKRCLFILGRACMGLKTLSFTTAKLKDELTREKKVAAGDSRMFLVVPMERIVTSTALFRKFREAYLSRGDEFRHAVGMDVHSPDVYSLVRYLQKFPNVIVGDYKKFDSHQHQDLARLNHRVLNRVFQHCCKDKWNLARAVLLDMKIESEILINDTVLRLTRGNKSGDDMTTEENNRINDTQIIYVFFILFKEEHGHFPILDDFLNNVRVKFFGDDMIMTVSNEVVGWFNFVTIQKALKGIGMELTPADKSDSCEPTVSWEKATFLKRSFSMLGGLHVMPLEKDSIEGVFGYTTNAPEDIEIWEEIVKTQLLEAVLHGQEYYDYFRGRLIHEIETNPWLCDSHKSAYYKHLLVEYNHQVTKYKIHYEKK